MMPCADLPNIGILIDELNPFSFQILKKDIEKFKNDFYNTHSSDETKDLLRLFHKKKSGYSTDYELSTNVKDMINKEVFKLVNQFEDRYKYFYKIFNYTTNIEESDIEIELERIWLNFQRPGEFLPLHNHTGVYSFVIWVDVPFKMQDEFDGISNPDLIKGRAGKFEFVYTDSLGKLSSHTLPVDKSWEGKVCVFPSDLYHQVYPFYSTTGVRISVAGNYRIKLVEIKK